MSGDLSGPPTSVVAGDPVSDAALTVRNLHKRFELARSSFRGPRATVGAVVDVNFSVGVGETVGVVGESGCGKTTLGRMIVGLTEPTDGEILVGGRLQQPLRWRDRAGDGSVQIVFQDPLRTLNPFVPIVDSVMEPLRSVAGLSRAAARERAHEVLERVGIPVAQHSRLPRQFSGGQCQRIGIARALAPRPKLIVLDEPVSALDVSVQAQILNLLRDIQSDGELAMLFISHDLGVVRNIADRVATMYLGRLVEVGPAEDVFRSPAHPYTRSLIAASPRLRFDATESRTDLMTGDPPSPVAPPSGCVFRTRCPIAQPECASNVPVLEQLADDRAVACWYPLEVTHRVR